MFWTILSGPIISFIALLLWPDTLGVVTAGPVCVDSTEEDGSILPLCYQCLGHSWRMAKPDPRPLPFGVWWQCSRSPLNVDEDWDFNFNFTGSPVDAQFLASSEHRNWISNANTSVNYFLDSEETIPVELNETSETGGTSLQLQFIVQGRPNGQHTLNGTLFIPSTISIDYLILIYKEGTHDSPKSTVSNTGPVTPLSTNTNEATTKPPGVSFNTGDASSTNLGAMIGGIVLGITVLTLAIATVLWYRFKRHSKTGRSRFTAPPVEDLPSPSVPPKSTRSRSMTYDPPGYTEKNAYFGIETPPGNSSALSPNAPEKGFDTASPPLLLA